MNVEAMTNNLGLWIICSVMVIVILVQSILYFRLGRAEAKKAANPEREGDPRHSRRGDHSDWPNNFLGDRALVSRGYDRWPNGVDAPERRRRGTNRDGDCIYGAGDLAGKFF